MAVQLVERDAEPMANVLSPRILPHADRLDWFADHGMPDTPALRSLAAAHRLDPHGALATSADTQAYREWIDGHTAARVYHEWLVTHPGYFLTAPFDNVGASLPISHYRAPGFRSLLRAGVQRVLRTGVVVDALGSDRSGVGYILAPMVCTGLASRGRGGSPRTAAARGVARRHGGDGAPLVPRGHAGAPRSSTGNLCARVHTGSFATRSRSPQTQETGATEEDPQLVKRGVE